LSPGRGEEGSGLATVTVAEEQVVTVKKTVTLVMSEAEARRIVARIEVAPRVTGDDGNDIAGQIERALL
jgi:hypothetical protein